MSAYARRAAAVGAVGAGASLLGLHDRCKTCCIIFSYMLYVHVHVHV